MKNQKLYEERDQLLEQIDNGIFKVSEPFISINKKQVRIRRLTKLNDQLTQILLKLGEHGQKDVF